VKVVSFKKLKTLCPLCPLVLFLSVNYNQLVVIITTYIDALPSPLTSTVSLFIGGITKKYRYTSEKRQE